MCDINRMRLCIEVSGVGLTGTLSLPQSATGIVVFAHSDDIGRHRSHNHAVAETFHRSGLATLEFNLLTPDEECIDLRTHNLRFNVRLLTTRLKAVTTWLIQYPHTQGLEIGYFGTNAGAAAAFIAAADYPNIVKAIVSRGSNIDLVSHTLRRVRTPTLLIAGEDDLPIISVSQDAFNQLQTEKRLEMIPGASHLFEEPGTLAKAAQLASQWYQQHLGLAPAVLAS
jgi:putative phosphoribosyl transferase